MLAFFIVPLARSDDGKDAVLDRDACRILRRWARREIDEDVGPAL
jgi:hypothetical protein